MKKRKIVTKANFEPEKTKKTITTGKSLTIPNQVLSIKDIMKRYVSGVPMGDITKNPVFQNEDPLEGRDFKSMDLSEQHEIMQENAKKIEDAIKENYKRKRDQEKEEIIQQYKKQLEDEQRENPENKPNDPE